MRVLLAAMLLLSGCGPMQALVSRDYRIEQLKAEHYEVWQAWAPKIEAGLVTEGMPKSAVRASWGPPSDVSRNSWGDTWRWGGCTRWGCNTSTVWFDRQGRVEGWSVD